MYGGRFMKPADPIRGGEGGKSRQFGSLDSEVSPLALGRCHPRARGVSDRFVRRSSIISMRCSICGSTIFGTP